MARDTTLSLSFPATPHGHLRLAAALPPQPRRRPKRRGGTPTYPNRAEHAASVREHAIRSVRTHHLRSPVLGVEPELVLVIELAHRLDPVLLERAELRVLDLTGELAMVAFASDPELTEFLRRLDAYSIGPRRDARGTERSAPYEALFDAIVFTVPVPSSFAERGGWRRITVALAYDPPVRPTRLDYLASRMDFWAFRSVTVEQVRNAYAAPLEDANTVPATLTDLHLELQPSTTLRSPGANQWASRTFPQLFKGGQRELVIVVRNTNRWDGDGNKQNYALAVVLERDPRQSALYAELRAQFELLAEAEIELQ